MRDLSRISCTSLALFAHKQSWRAATCELLIPLAPCAVLFVTLALSTRCLAPVAITVAVCGLVDLIVSLFRSTAFEAPGAGCIQHPVGRCTYSTFRRIVRLSIIFACSAALVARSADLIRISSGGPALWASTKTLRVCVRVPVGLICLVEQECWGLLELRPAGWRRSSLFVCQWNSFSIDFFEIWLLVKVFQGTRGPAFGAVALVHLVVVIIETFTFTCWRLLAIFAWAQALQNWDQLVALNHVHDILGLFAGCILGELVGLEFESYSAPIVHRVRQLDLDGHWTTCIRRSARLAVFWRNGIGNGQESRTFSRRAFR